MTIEMNPIGLSKREHFAALILAGLCANPDISSDIPVGEMATMAIGQADELLKQLGCSVEVDDDPEDLAMAELRSEYYRGDGPLSVEVEVSDDN